LIHNKIYIFGKSSVTYHNIPLHYDIMVIPYPQAIDYKNIADRMDFTGVLMDMGTGTFEPIFLRKLPIFQKIFNVFLPNRAEINKMLDLQFLIEGRYLSFWFTAMEEDFRPVGYAPFHVPDEFEIYKYEAGMQYFYSLNWGQKSIEDVYKQRMVAIVYDGFSKIHFNQISSMEIQLDYRVLKVNLDYPMPEIIVSDIDVITTFLYVRSNKEDITFNFVTSDIAYVTLDLVEDYKNYYNPFTESPKIYPEGV